MRLCKKCCNELGMVMLRTYGGQCVCRRCGKRLWKCGWCVNPKEETGKTDCDATRTTGEANKCPAVYAEKKEA